MAQVITIPVFVYPTSLKFNLNESSNHKQLMTIYNPYDFSVKFKVSSNAPNKYLVIDPEGSIAAKSSIDVIITHCVPAISNCGTVDRFRVSLADCKTQKITGKTEIDAILLEYEDDGLMENRSDYFHSMSKRSDSSKSRDRSRGREHIVDNDINKFQKPIVFIAAVVAMAVLLMVPLTEGRPNDFPPAYIELCSLSKVGISFLIGAISCYYMFPQNRSQNVQSDTR